MDTQFWSMVVDGVGLLLCAAAIGCARRLAGAPTDLPRAAPQGDFAGGMRQAFVQQRMEAALAGVAEALAHAHRLLGGEAEAPTGPVAAAPAGPSVAQTAPWAPPCGGAGGEVQGAQADRRNFDASERYREAIDLARRGLSSERIARRVRLPAAELDLIVRLRGRPAGGEKSASPGAAAAVEN
jgi:hypothetical protein